MKKPSLVTLLVVTVVALVALSSTRVLAATVNKSADNKVVMSADQMISAEPFNSEIHADFLISRSTSLYNHQDGTKKEGIDYALLPSFTTSLGKISTKFIYSQDLVDESKSASDWNDIPVIYSLKPYQWTWSPPYILMLTPFTSVVIPVSQVSVKRDELKTALSLGVSFGIKPDGIAIQKDGAWSLGISLTAGKNFHQFAENINGQVLNQYSSNQSATLGYTFQNISISVEYINKIRWTYQNNTRSSFEHTEEVAYNVTENLNVAVGHTNAGSSVKMNGSDSNLEFINENDSQVYGTLGFSF